MNDKLHKLKQEFLEYWTIEKLQNMTLEEYTDTERDNSFCYWLEHITRDLGSIVGGSSYKFGIYKMGATSKTESATNRTNDGVYAWHTKYGETTLEAFSTIKGLIIKISDYAKADNLNPIEDIDLGDAYKWKIAFLYSDYKIINIFKNDALKFVANSLFSNNNIPNNYGDLNHYILSYNTDENYFDFTKKLWQHYDNYNSKEKEFKKWLEDYGEKGSNKTSSYLRAIKILINEFKIAVYTENDINVLQDLYEDLIINQRDPNGKYAYHKKSYGEKGFYSAAIKTYIQFLKNEPISDIVNEDEEKYTMENLEKSKPINQILYGPPGTGKTFYLKDQLFDKYTLKENAITKEKYFEEVVTNLTWWQVITLALIEIGTSKVNDILENKWVAKKAALSESKNVRATLWGTLQMHTIVESKNVAYKQRQNPFIFDKTNEKTWQLLSDEVKEQSPEIYDILKEVNNFKLNPQKEIKNYDFVTFHQSFAYEDFIEGIKPISPEEGEESKDLGYAIEDGVFKKLCLRAKNDPNNRYAIFIDEINRGNVSAIFGELITLIEIDKRKGADNEISIKLPYSKTAFSVPSNIDIYGTMNTADRSVEALDTALRRRFEFKEMMPDYTVIDHEEVEGIKLSEVLEKINQRIELLIDRDHTIGHSYFVNVNSPEKLANAFNNKIVPLLQEYFYGDYGKIGLVLGNGFVEIKKNDTINFAEFKYENSNDFKIASYKLKHVEEDTVIDATLELLGKKETPQ